MLSNTPPSPLAPDDPTTPACVLRHRSACWHPLLPQPHLVSTATDTTAAPTVCASPPGFSALQTRVYPNSAGLSGTCRPHSFIRCPQLHLSFVHGVRRLRISISSSVCAPCASAPSLLEACFHRSDVRPQGTICSRSFSSAPSPLEARAQRHDTRPHGASFCVCNPEVTVTSLHPPRLCRLAVFSIKPTLLRAAPAASACVCLGTFAPSKSLPQLPLGCSCAPSHFFKRVSTDTTLALQAPAAPSTSAFVLLHILKRASTDTTLALLEPAALTASACVCLRTLPLQTCLRQQDARPQAPAAPAASAHACFRIFAYPSARPPTQHDARLPGIRCSLSLSSCGLLHPCLFKRVSTARRSPTRHQPLLQLQLACASAPSLLQAHVHRHDAGPPGTHPPLPQLHRVCAFARLSTICSRGFSLRVPQHLQARVHRHDTLQPGTHMLLPQIQLACASAPLPIQARVHRHVARPHGIRCSRRLCVLRRLHFFIRVSTNTTRTLMAPAAAAASACVCSGTFAPSRLLPQLQLVCSSAPSPSSNACQPTRRSPSRHAPAAPAASA